ncbi:hypothetical protein ABH892_004455 [Paenibacillus sp. RC254]|uniref:hypothetical protein n=1 Tax=unclassified Paenibacillus TaxID=185978 RepID=UPI0024BA6464|nr:MULTISPECIES: hypothetical protein [unclassified Paenibacillus]
MRGAKKEKTGQPAHQGRWTRIGTAIGDTIQRDILFADKHNPQPPSKFSFEYNGRGEPMFEDFAKVSRVIEHGGKTFALYGTCDGIMLYVSEDGEIMRVGLEIKSKQTTYSMTSGFSARKGPKEDHVKQCICYSVMYDVDYYVILYVNGSKKSWNMTEDEFAKNPDILAFGLYITDEMRNDVLDHFAGIVHAAETGDAPALDLDKWLFNDFKRTIAVSLTEAEITKLERKVIALNHSSLPDWKKRGPSEALADIMRIRAEVTEGQTKEAA